MTKIDGKTPNSVPASVAKAMRNGMPKHQALAQGPKPKSMVRVGR